MKETALFVLRLLLMSSLNAAMIGILNLDLGSSRVAQFWFVAWTGRHIWTGWRKFCLVLLGDDPEGWIRAWVRLLLQRKPADVSWRHWVYLNLLLIERAVFGQK